MSSNGLLQLNIFPEGRAHLEKFGFNGNDKLNFSSANCGLTRNIGKLKPCFFFFFFFFGGGGGGGEGKYVV